MVKGIEGVGGPVRLVVTGQDPKTGKSVFESDAKVDPIVLSLVPGPGFHRLWGSDEPPLLPTDGAPPPTPRYFPGPGGYRFGFFSLAPDETGIPADLDIGAAFAELQEKLPGMADVMEADHPGMHTTDTVDFEVVLSGEVWLELDDGAEVHLQPGDCVVQNGTRHAWHNKGKEPVTLFVALLGAERKS
jgi:mannose-6-phosphate isomerase-like protein (cupin superfamily)